MWKVGANREAAKRSSTSQSAHFLCESSCELSRFSHLSLQIFTLTRAHLSTVVEKDLEIKKKGKNLIFKIIAQFEFEASVQLNP